MASISGTFLHVVTACMLGCYHAQFAIRHRYHTDALAQACCLCYCTGVLPVSLHEEAGPQRGKLRSAQLLRRRREEAIVDIFERNTYSVVNVIDYGMVVRHLSSVQ